MITRKRFLIRGSMISAGLMVFKTMYPFHLNGQSKRGNFKSNTASSSEPSYHKLLRNGELQKRWKFLWSRMSSCDLCPRDCKKNRLRGIKGTCGSDNHVRIASWHPHFGEEKELVGKNGSGTIFLSNCAMRCVFCINHDISQGGAGTNRTIREFADMMIAVQNMGCHNLNLVTPTQYLPHILRALEIAASEGLNIPIVYNTHGWEKMDILQMLDGVVDIYLPDFKYAEPAMGSIYSAGASSYPEISQKALMEMHRQVGIAIPDKQTGLMQRGLMIRHLVMPNHIENSKKIVQWIAENLPSDTYVNLMSQYRPSFKAKNFPEISRAITMDEYKEVVETAIKAGLKNIRTQGNV